MELEEAKTKLKETWRAIVYDHSDTVSMLGHEMTKRRLKQLNQIIDEMPAEEVMVELQENEEYLAFNA